jgi:hypothetical protein
MILSIPATHLRYPIACQGVVQLPTPSSNSSGIRGFLVKSVHVLKLQLGRNVFGLHIFVNESGLLLVLFSFSFDFLNDVSYRVD